MLSTYLWWGLFSLILQTSAQQGLNCAPCQRTRALLSQCELPPLTTDFHTFDGHVTVRNVSQAPDFFDFHVDGPKTNIIANYTSAQCLCSHVNDVSTCAQDCTNVGDNFASGSPEYNEYQMGAIYTADCAEFGYYKNVTQAYASTTITSLPLATAPPSETPPDCAACDALASQLTQCNATSTDGARYPPLDSTPGQPQVLNLGDMITGRWILVNRTMGECVCTLPVVRRFAACGDCAGSMLSMVISYEDDCGNLGYYSDSQAVIPPDDIVSSTPSSTSSMTASLTATGSSGTATTASTAKSVAGSTNRAFKGIGFTLFGFWLGVGFL